MKKISFIFQLIFFRLNKKIQEMILVRNELMIDEDFICIFGKT